MKIVFRKVIPFYMSISIVPALLSPAHFFIYIMCDAEIKFLEQEQEFLNKRAKRLFLDADSRMYRQRLKALLNAGYVKGEFHYVRGGSSRQEILLK